MLWKRTSWGGHKDPSSNIFDEKKQWNNLMGKKIRTKNQTITNRISWKINIESKFWSNFCLYKSNLLKCRNNLSNKFIKFFKWKAEENLRAPHIRWERERNKRINEKTRQYIGGAPQAIYHQNSYSLCSVYISKA